MGKPMTRLFAVLSLVDLGCLGVASVALYRAGWPPDMLSGSFWLWLALAVSELVFLVLAMNYALTEKPNPRPTEPYDIRKLY